MLRLRLLTKVNDRIEKLLLAVSVLLLIAFSSIVFIQIIFRNVFKIPMMWSIEVSLLCFFWAVFLGAAVGLRYRRHYTVELLPEKFMRTNLFLEIISHLIVLLMIYVFVVHGYKFAAMGFSKMSTSIAMPQGYFFLSLPVGGVAMVLFSIELLAIDIKKMIHLVKGGN